MLRIDDVNYTDLIVEALTRFPDRDAFAFEGSRWSYKATAARISQFIGVFRQRGIGPGRTVAVLSSNCPEVWMVQAACYLLGARYVGLHALGSVKDHAFAASDAEAEMLIAHPKFSEHAGQVAALSNIPLVLSIGPSEIGSDLLSLADREQVRSLVRCRLDAEDVNWIAYTGGTTGRSKGVLIPSRALMTQVQTLSTSFAFPDTPRYLAVAPISHAGMLPILPTLLRGGTVVLQRSFDPEHWLRTVQDEHINWTFTVPTMLYTLLDQERFGDYDLSSLETVMYGSSPMNPSRIQEAHEALGQVLLQAYGQAECVSWATTLRREEHDPGRRPELLSSCGRPVLGMRVEVLDEDHRPLPAGEVGEICVRGPGIMKGYHNLPAETEEAFAGEWLHTGDLALRDEQGFFYIVERKKDMIVTGGFNVYSREVEDAIAELPNIASVAVIGVPDDHWGEAVKAVVVPKPGAIVDVNEVIQHVRMSKGGHQAPKTVDVVDALPLTAVSKVDKKQLRSTYWSSKERQVH